VPRRPPSIWNAEPKYNVYFGQDIFLEESGENQPKKEEREVINY